jgi:Rhodopirellula transposase DDE domain
MLASLGFSPQGNAKVTEGNQHADRDAQFAYLAAQVGQQAETGQPVVSVDAKKKELVGPFKNGGRQYAPTGTPEQVNVHDFPTRSSARPSPTASTMCPRTAAGRGLSLMATDIRCQCRRVRRAVVPLATRNHAYTRFL